MYRIRSASGTEAVYNSLEEFSAAVRQGAVSAEDEIFHSRANRWLDVKSHPHYRTALSWTPGTSGANGGNGGGVATTVRPAPSAIAAASQPAPPPPQTRAQVFERPVAKAPPQTVVRPQLQSAPVAPASAPPPAVASAPVAEPPARPAGPPPKSRELTFVDLGPTAPPARKAPEPEVAPVVEAKKPLPKLQPPVQPKKSAVSTREDGDFLVMDGGIESPARTSTGYRTIPEDLDLLFDTPLTDAEAPKAPKAPRQEPQPKPVVASAPAAVEPAAPPAPPAPVAAAPAPAPAPVAASAPKPPVVNAPAPKAPAPPAPKATSPVLKIEPELDEDREEELGEITIAPPKAPPVVNFVPAHPVVKEDLTIPAGAMLDVPVAAPTPTPAPAARAPRWMVGAGVAAVALVGAVLMLHPWSGKGTVTPPAAEAQAASTTTSAPPPSIPSPVAAAPTSTKPGSTVNKPAESPSGRPSEVAAVRTDSAAPADDPDKVIAAVKPNFKADFALPAADLGVGSPTSAARGAAVSPAEYTRRFVAAQKLAQQELQSRLAAAGFRNLFDGDRLANSAGVTQARTAWNSGADAIRQFRSRVARTEQAYEDSVLSAQRSQKWPAEDLRAWAARPSAGENGETAQLSDLMVNQVNEALDLLAASDGQYEIKGGKVVFKSPGSGTRYISIRSWVEQRMQGWAATPEGARPASTSALLRGLGDGLPAAQ